MVAVNPDTSVVELHNNQGITVGQLQSGIVSTKSRKRNLQKKARSESGQQWAAK